MTNSQSVKSLFKHMPNLLKHVAFAHVCHSPVFLFSMQTDILCSDHGIQLIHKFHANLAMQM
jgi:hypothetical protein